MKTKLIAVLALLSASTLFAAPRVAVRVGIGIAPVYPYAAVYPYGYVAPAPVVPAPAPVAVMPPAPAPGYVWVGGYWGFVGGRRVWVPGYWHRPVYGFRGGFRR